MTTSKQLTELIGNTPIVKLQQASEATGCEIFGKCEFLNPGGSIKDRTALGLLQHAIDNKLISPGGTFIEGTAGNTGIGLTILANALGYKTLVVMPMNQSREKIDLLELLGAELRLVQATSYDDPKHYVHTAQRIADELNAKQPQSAFWTHQFDNPANKNIHYQTTGQEIWQQMGGNIDGFICAMGTGGTLNGVGKALKEQDANVSIGLADPQGSSLHHYFTQGSLKSNGNSISEGIGISHLTANMAELDLDFSYSISDEEALPLLFNLTRQEGLCLGSSSAINIAGAVRLAKQLGPGHRIVTILCDSGTRYQSKLFNPTFLRSKGLPVPEWLR